MKKLYLMLIGILLLGIIPGIAAAPDTASIKASLLSQDPDPALPGSIVDVRFKLENVGRDDLANAEFEILADHPFTLEPGDNGKRQPGTIFGGQIGEEAYVLKYKLIVSENAIEGDYEVRLRYTSDGGENWRRLDPFNLNVKTRDPILAITSISTEPEMVALGEEVTLRIGMENIADSYVKNVRVGLNLIQAKTMNGVTQVIDLPFSPVDSSNEKIIKLLNAGSKNVITFKLISDASAEPKIYKIPLTLTYEDDVGTEHIKEGIASIRVGQAPENLVTLENTNIFFVGEETTFDVKFTNNGLVDIKLLTVEIADSADFDLISPKIVYVGNIDSDDYENADFTVKILKADNDKISIPLKISYKDPNNKEYKSEVTLTHKALTMEKALATGVKQEQNYNTIIIAVVVIVVLFVLYKILTKKRK